MRAARVLLAMVVAAAVAPAQVLFIDGFENGKLGYWTDSLSEPPFCPTVDGTPAPLCTGSPNVPEWLQSCTVDGSWPSIVCLRRCYNTWGFDACLDLQVLEDPFPEP